MKEQINSGNPLLITRKEPNGSFEWALQNASIGLVVSDLHGDIKQSNLPFNKLLGYAGEELVGKRLELLVHPQDVQLFQAILVSLLENSDGRDLREIRFMHRSGHAVWVRNGYTLMKDPTGNPGTIMIISSNITEEKLAQFKAEEVTRRFRFLADSMPQLIWTADAEGRIDYLSHSFYEYSGFNSASVKNNGLKEIIFKEDLEKTRNLWVNSIQTGETFIAEHRIKRRDGSFTWQLSRAVPQRDEQGKIIMWVGSTSDIHRLKNVEDNLEKLVLERTRDLQEAHFNLEHSNHDLEQFAHIATHDLQEPLRKIRTYASGLSSNFSKLQPAEVLDYVIKIERAAERMSVLIDDLLNYSLLLRPQELFEDIDLNIILNRVLKDNEGLVEQKDAVVQSMHLPQMKVITMQIYQLFSNLLSNALKFSSPERKPLINIRSRQIFEEEVIALGLNMEIPYVEIVFEDNGIGFMQEYAEKIFSIFQRLNNRNKYPGTGIGLALCKKIIQYHHGQIYARAIENEGTSIYVLLPA